MRTTTSKTKIAAVAMLLTGLTLSSSLLAQNISSTWHSKLSLPAGSLTIVFHIRHTEQGTYVATLSSPDQGTENIKTETTSFQDSVPTVQISAIHASYKGRLDADRTITGIFTQGIPLPLDLTRGEFSGPKRPQEPQSPFPYKVEEVSVRNTQGRITLADTLTLPKKGNKFPAVVLVTGSNTQNRDEEITGHKPFFVIADYLTRNGIAVLRYDDHGTATSQGDYASATNGDFTKTTGATLNYLRNRKEINTRKISIIGHSCDGTITFDAAVKDPNVSLIISLVGATVRGGSLMLKQVELISKPQEIPDPVRQIMRPSVRHRHSLLQQTAKSSDEIRKEVYADVTRTMSAEQLKNLSTVQQLSAQIDSMTSPWCLHFMRYDPTISLKKVKCPVLALNGEKGIQVDADMNLTVIKQHISENGSKNVTIKAYPKLNRLFQTCEKGTLAEYRQLEETINPEVLKDTTGWIKRQ